MEFPIIKKQIWALDFDGTLCVHMYPEIGPANKELIAKAIAHQKDGGKLILWTCRSSEDLEKALAWSKEQGLIFDAVNEDVPEIKNSEYGRNKSVKIFADIYFDDRSIRMVAGDDQVTSLLKTYLK